MLYPTPLVQDKSVLNKEQERDSRCFLFNNDLYCTKVDTVNLQNRTQEIAATRISGNEVNQKKVFSESMHRPKLFYWNESVHCTPIDRVLKKRDSKRGREAFYVQLFLIYGRFSSSRIFVLFLDKINVKI